MISATINETVRLFVEAAPYLLLGFMIAGVIRFFLPLSMVKKFLGKKGTKSVVRAALIGAPLPLCSCSVLPTAASLKAQGASKGAVTSFLIATPETGADSIALTYALLDPVMALARPVAAIGTAVFAGMAEIKFGKPEPADPPPEKHDSDCSASDCALKKEEGKATITAKVWNGIRYASIDLMDDLAGWILVGMILAGIASALIPADFFVTIPVGDWFTMPLMLLFGVPLYLCASASTPLAAALVAKGLSPGAALVFLMAGPATNIGSIMVVRKVLGGRSTIIYLASIAIATLVFGMILNAIYALLGIDASAVVGSATELLPPLVEYISAVILGLAMGSALFRQAMGLLRSR